MSIQIDGITYFVIADVLDELKISRQTLWRWRSEGKIPLGHRYRDRRILFTADEFDAIRSYANHLEPAQIRTPSQLRLHLSGG